MTSGQVAQHYDRLHALQRALWGDTLHHGWWETGRETLPEARAALRAAVRARVGEEARPVCDVGCGYGVLTRELARAGGESWGITNSLRQHAQARLDAAEVPGARFHPGCWLAGAWPPAYFQAVVALESLEHMAERERFFAQAAYVLRPGGRLVVAGWQRRVGRASLPERLLLRVLLHCACMPPLGTPPEVRAAAERAGLVTEQEEDWTAPTRRTWPALFGSLWARLGREPRLALALPRHWRLGVGAVCAWLACRQGALRYRCTIFRKR